MARRRPRPGRFGDPTSDHRFEFDRGYELATRMYRDAQRAFRRGQCRLGHGYAVSYLLEFAAAKTHAHSAKMYHAPIDNVRRRKLDSMKRAARRVMRSMDACIVRDR